MPYTEYRVYLSNEGEQITMKDKVVFFILGALLATIAYLAGDLETSTAQDKTVELEKLRVAQLFITDTLMVGDRGAMYVEITADNQSARLSLHGTKVERNPDLDKPYVILRASVDGAIIQARSHSKRPEAVVHLGIGGSEGEYVSGIMLEDLNGKKYVTTVP